ncbi:hypothetical protein [Actinophytocola sp.]|uniref:hypothetical protein n=1 Tax=Actinophytocola sp. TaxID=1872138 RepID=UPI003D6C4FB5
MFVDPNLAIAASALAVATVARAWFAFRRTHIRETSTTDRFVKALEDSTPQERSDIIRALAEAHTTKPAVEATSTDPPDSPDSPERPILAWLRRRWPSPPSTKDG